MLETDPSTVHSLVFFFRLCSQENRSINNYVDLGMELVYRNEGSTGAARTANALTPPSLRIGAAWQINKNSMVKVRVEDSSVSALFALKSWWDPSASAAFSVNHGLHNRQTTVSGQEQDMRRGSVDISAEEATLLTPPFSLLFLLLSSPVRPVPQP